MGPGPRNLITDVAGLTIGNAEDAGALTGVTVLLPDEAAVMAADVRGGAPGTRDIDALDPSGFVQGGYGIVLSGGSVHGLAAASGVCNWLGARGRGIHMTSPGGPVAPIVPAAILFDLANGGDKDWGEAPPYEELGRRACAAASTDFALGNAGAGMGAISGIYKGGLGSASTRLDNGITVGALMAMNAIGSPVMPGSDCFWAWAFEQGAEFGGVRPPANYAAGPALPDDTKFARAARENENTVIGIVATDAGLSRGEARRLAIMAQDGIALAVQPSHTALDGDTIFAVATGKSDAARPGASVTPSRMARLGATAAHCVARACARAVFEATGIPGAQSWRTTFGR